MSTRHRQISCLVQLTAAEALRQPVCLLLTATCVAATLLVPLLSLHNLGEGGRLARDGGLAFQLVFGLLVTGHAASSTLSGEIRRGTAAAVLAKPVGRITFFLSKYLGVAIVALSFSGCASIATLLAERIAEKFYELPGMTGYAMDWRVAQLALFAVPVAFLAAGVLNYTRGRPFQSAAFGSMLIMLALVLLVGGLFDQGGRWAPYDMRVAWRTAVASGMVALALLVLAAIALSLSTRLSTAPTLVLCVGFLLAGLGATRWIGEEAALLSGVSEMLLPNWQHFWAADYLSDNGCVPVHIVAGVAVYAAAYTGGILCLGALSFHHAEVSSR